MAEAPGFELSECYESDARPIALVYRNGTERKAASLPAFDECAGV